MYQCRWEYSNVEITKLKEKNLQLRERWLHVFQEHMRATRFSVCLLLVFPLLNYSFSVCRWGKIDELKEVNLLRDLQFERDRNNSIENKVSAYVIVPPFQLIANLVRMSALDELGRIVKLNVSYSLYPHSNPWEGKLRSQKRSSLLWDDTA